MKVAFDASTLAFKDKTGTGVFSEELIKAYEKCFSYEDEIIHTYRLSRRIRGRKFLRPLSKNISRATLIDPITAFRGRNYDIFHGLNSRLPVLTHTKLIASVHDLFSIYGAFSKSEFKEDQKTKLNQTISRADHIITLSTFVKNQIATQVGYDFNKMTVVPLGVRERFLVPPNKFESQKVVREKMGLNNPFVFFVGALEKRKNVAGLVEAFAYFLGNYKRPLDLVLGGHAGFEFEIIKKAIEQSGYKERIKTLGFVGEEDLAHLYGACDVFAFPSFEEGFGMPVIEAMACGAPVISSNTTSLPEAGGGFSWLIDPNSKEQIAKSMGEILNRDPYVIERTKSGEAYAKSLTWEKVARLTRDVYQKLLLESP